MIVPANTVFLGVASKLVIEQKYWHCHRGNMKYSARNALTGTIRELNPGAINTEVVIEIAPGVEVVSIITKASSERLELAVGKEVVTLIKASNVILAAE